MMKKAIPIKEVKQKRYDELMRYAGKIEAIHLLLENLEGIEYDAITEEEFDELVTQSSSHIFEAKQIIEKYAKELR